MVQTVGSRADRVKPARRAGLALALASAALFAAGCPRTPNAVIKVSVDVDAAVKSTCFRIVAKPVAGGAEVLSTPVLRKARIEAAVYSSAELSGEVVFVARGFVGAGCDEPLALNDESAPASQTFVKDETREVLLSVKAPGADVDADRDGYRSSGRGGPDCDDNRAAVHPGAPEFCSDGLDNDCNGQTDCADSACAGGSCDDGLNCTTGDKCQSDGKCAGAPVVCPGPTPAGCRFAACNPVTGLCVNSKYDAGTTCDDLDPCTTTDLCLGDGGCHGTSVSCAVPPGACFTSAGVCKADAGGCVYAPLDAGASCNDGDLCTVNDGCSAAGTCVGTPVVCATPPGQCFSASGSCNAGDGTCSYVVTSGGACSDGNPCTTNDTCAPDGGCEGTAFSCNSPPGGACYSALGACLGDGGCLYTPLDAGALCNDGDLCTTADTCTVGGACVGTAVVCNSAPQCFLASAGSCNPADGTCSYPVTGGAACSDGNPCTLNDTCLLDGGCGSGAAFTCGSPPNTCYLASGSCLSDGGCLYPGRDAGALCNDGNACTTGDACSATLTCDAVAVTCGTAPGQCYSSAGTCNASDGGCTYPVNTGAACSDGNDCTAGDLCQADGTCASGVAFTCSTPPNSCFLTTGACLADGGCTYSVNPANRYMSCGAGVCFADGGCVAPSFPYTPSNFNPVTVAAGGITPSVTLNCAAVFNSSPSASPAFVNWCGETPPVVQVAVQPGGPDAVVLAMYSFTVGDAGSLQVIGTRPVIFAVYDQAQIFGTLLATANLDDAGPGGSTTFCGTSHGDAGVTSNARGSGGGGAGFGGQGADGGNANGLAMSGGRGGTAGGSATLVPLRGGCSGGPGGLGTAAVGAGGAGGGAIQVSAANALWVSGNISSSGGGGRGATSGNSGGGGAGSGGAVLLESSAMTISSTAKLTANGGGGGGGASSGAAGSPGQNGSWSSAAVATGGPGGGTGTTAGSAGGPGGAGTTAPLNGASGAANRSGGGGGGAVGRILLNGASSCSTDAGAIISPPATIVCP
jgi:hypothetical protein